MNLDIIQKAKKHKQRLKGYTVAVSIAVIAIVTSVLYTSFSQYYRYTPASQLKTASADMSISEIPFEFGEASVFMRDQPPYYSSVVYPETGLSLIDEAVVDFAKKADENAYQVWQTRCSEKGKRLKGAYSMRCRTYSVADGLGVIEAIGSYNDEGGDPVDSVKVFNVDLNNNRILNRAELFDLTQEKKLLEKFEKRISERYPGTEAKLDRADLASIAILADGARLELPRGDRVPSQYGLVQVDIPYSELDDMVIVSSDTVKKRDYSNIDKNRKYIALTFDDGPSAYTEQILSLLNKYGGKGTFFVLGSKVANYAEVERMIIQSGSEIYGHSWDHSDLTKLSEESLRQQLIKTNMAIYKATDTVPRYYRPPYGATNEQVRRVSKDLGLSLINWNVDTEDWKSRNASSVYKRAFDGLNNGGIILFHDIYPSTVEAMRAIMPELYNRGYQFVTIDELIHINHGEPEPGKLYYH